MESIDDVEGSVPCSHRLVPQIGPNHQVTMPPLKQSARIASLEYISRDQWYACGLPAVPIMYIAASDSPLPRKRRNSADRDKSFSLASTSNSRTHALLPTQQEQHQKNLCTEAVFCKDANSCASSTKETCQAWKKEESFATTMKESFHASQSEHKPMVMLEDVPGVSAQSELKSSLTFAMQVTSIIKKKKKRRSCWQTLKRKGNKKAKMEKGRKDKRWSGSLHSEVGEASEQGSARPVSEKCTVLPGSQPDSWSEEEVAAFTLALYLFDKDFRAIKRFLETKKMKDIVHHYYGQFYGTTAFCRWAGSKNSRSRKCVHGPRILQGWRQDELLKRLLPHVPDSARHEISEGVRAFNERDLTVEGFVAELKAAVGLEVLVQCVGIGVPKRDLTAVTTVHADSAKNGTHPLSARVDGMPVGKACSLLSKEEMLESITGNFRISKTRAQELFWEAVWPLLLTHGWHSTECDLTGLPGSKSTVVFLRPGVAKIDKGSSERGVLYYDSVREVLKAVASDPSLLDGPELTGDTMEGSENQEDEDVQGWSDDMFETLDTHRLRGIRPGKTEVEAKNEEVEFKSCSASDEHDVQNSSESSSVDIDLNRPLSAVSSKSPEPKDEEEKDRVQLRSAASCHVVGNSHPRFPIEEIDLNLPPLDIDCNSPALTIEEDSLEVPTSRSSPGLTFSTPVPAPEENVEVSDPKPWDLNPMVMHTFIAASVEEGCTHTTGSINLNDPLPMAEMMIMEEAGLDTSEQLGLGGKENFAAQTVGVPRTWPLDGQWMASPGQDIMYTPKLHDASSCTCRSANSCKCKSRKRSLSYQESETSAEVVYSGKELIPVPKKRATRRGHPFSLDALRTPEFVFTMDDAVARMRSWSNSVFPPVLSRPNWRRDWNIRLSPSVLPLHVGEEFFQRSKLQLPKCKVVELDGDTEAVNRESDGEHRGNEGHGQGSLSVITPSQRLYQNVKRLRCRFPKRQVPVSASYSRSKLQRLPRKYTISIDSRSSKSHLLKAKERCSDWSWPQVESNGSSAVEGLNGCSSSHGNSAADSSGHQRVVEEFQQTRLNSEVLDGEPHCIKNEDCDLRRKPHWRGGAWESTSGTHSTDDDMDEDAHHHARPRLRDWKVPCLTLTSPGDSCDSYDLPRPMPRSRGIRSSGRSHSLPVKCIDRSLLNFDVGTKRTTTDSQEVDMSTEGKMDTSCSLIGHEMTEQDLLMTLCSMQEQQLEGRAISEEDAPKVKGKRSSRVRRRNFSFKNFIFGGLMEDVEEGLSVQPCTSQGPWQPTCHLPSNDKIARSPKLRRRRSGLPCKGSCVAAATGPIAPGSKGSSSSSNSKGQMGSRLPGQTLPSEEEATAPLNWPVHDVRFSLRRALSDGSVKTERQSGRKVPARWNLFSVC